MKRASYREAIRWIALNDGLGDLEALDPKCVAGLVSSKLIADIFDVPDERVGRDVVRERTKRPPVPGEA